MGKKLPSQWMSFPTGGTLPIVSKAVVVSPDKVLSIVEATAAEVIPGAQIVALRQDFVRIEIEISGTFSPHFRDKFRDQVQRQTSRPCEVSVPSKPRAQRTRRASAETFGPRPRSKKCDTSTELTQLAVPKRDFAWASPTVRIDPLLADGYTARTKNRWATQVSLTVAETLLDYWSRYRKSGAQAAAGLMHTAERHAYESVRRDQPAWDAQSSTPRAVNDARRLFAFSVLPTVLNDWDRDSLNQLSTKSRLPTIRDVAAWFDETGQTPNQVSPLDLLNNCRIFDQNTVYASWIEKFAGAAALLDLVSAVARRKCVPTAEVVRRVERFEPHLQKLIIEFNKAPAS